MLKNFLKLNVIFLVLAFSAKPLCASEAMLNEDEITRGMFSDFKERMSVLWDYYKTLEVPGIKYGSKQVKRVVNALMKNENFLNLRGSICSGPVKYRVIVIAALLSFIMNSSRTSKIGYFTGFVLLGLISLFFEPSETEMVAQSVVGSTVSADTSVSPADMQAAVASSNALVEQVIATIAQQNPEILSEAVVAEPVVVSPEVVVSELVEVVPAVEVAPFVVEAAVEVAPEAIVVATEAIEPVVVSEAEPVVTETVEVAPEVEVSSEAVEPAVEVTPEVISA